MYINQIDLYIDRMIDRFYFYLKENRVEKYYQMIDFVDHRDEINQLLENFFSKIPLEEIAQLFQNRENLLIVVDILKRYILYYFFLILAYYYTGSLQDYRNNLIIYSKMESEESKNLGVKNFFDVANNHQVVQYFRLIKSIMIVLGTPPERRRQLSPEHQEALQYLKELGEQYVDQFLLKVDDNKEVVINEHNLIKTIVFGRIYRAQDRITIFNLVNEIEQEKTESIYIEIVVSQEDLATPEELMGAFSVYPQAEILTNDLLELVGQSEKIVTSMVDINSSRMLEYHFIIPIVDDFLRYHRDSARLDTTLDKPIIFSKDNVKNVKSVLIYQQKRKKENTKVQLIINRIEALSDLYSTHDPKVRTEILKLFYAPLAYRKATVINYLEEVRVMKKIRDQGRKALEGNEYYPEIVEANSHAYFNFKDFAGYGMHINILSDRPINLLRYANIEYQRDHPEYFLDMHTGVSERPIGLVGFALAPLVDIPVQCLRKEDMLDIHGLELKYPHGDTVRTRNYSNGYQGFLKMVQHFYIDVLEDDRYLEQLRRLNPHLINKMVYWVYQLDRDEFQVPTYENLGYQTQDLIKYLNSHLCETIRSKLLRKLYQIVLVRAGVQSITQTEILDFIHQFSRDHRLFLTPRDQLEVYINYYLRNLKLTQAPSIPQKKILEHPKITLNVAPRTHELVISPYIRAQEQEIPSLNGLCQHEIDWQNLLKYRKNLQRFNELLTSFTEKYVIETYDLFFVCRVCGESLPIKQYLLDGSFDRSTQKFVPAYTPSEIPLEDLPEYQKYRLIIRFLDAFVTRISLVTGTNMLTGQNPQIVQRRKLFVKNVVDLFVRHNELDLQMSPEFYTTYGIDKDLDVLFRFEIDDTLLDISVKGDEKKAALNRLKVNNMLLYFVIIFMTELNGIQIVLMNYDKIANVFTYQKYAHKLLGKLSVRKSLGDPQGVALLDYPVLAYLIFVFSYFLVNKYRIWFYPKGQKIFIHSILSLINSIILSASQHPKEYVYELTVGKFYGALNNVFNNRDIISRLEKTHQKYQGKVPITQKTLRARQTVGTSGIWTFLSILKVPSVSYDLRNQRFYQISPGFTSLTNCPDGSFRRWHLEDKRLVSCESLDQNHDYFGKHYYYVLAKLAERRCPSGELHDFEGDVCRRCGKKMGQKYSREELDELVQNLEKRQLNLLQERYKKWKIVPSSPPNILGTLQNESQIRFFNILEEILGPSILLSWEKIPVNVQKNIYVIEYGTNGSPLEKPIIIQENSQKIRLQKSDAHFGRDVYVYQDESQTEVFYDAVTLRLLAYRERYRDYYADLPASYLRIVPSIREQYWMMGFRSRYQSTHGYTVEGLIREHLLGLRQTIDRFISILSRMNYSTTSEEIPEYSQELEALISKHRDIGPLDLNMDDWYILRQELRPQISEKVTLPEEVDYGTVNRIDLTGSLVQNYFLGKLSSLLDTTRDKKQRSNLARAYVDIIGYLYRVQNLDRYQTMLEYRRFVYLLNASSMLVDLTKKKIAASLESMEVPPIESLTQEEQEAAEDLREEAEALDVEPEEEEEE